VKRGLSRRIAKDYEPLLSTAAAWKRIGTEFMRRADEWVQVFGFKVSRFDDRYVPRSALQLLWMEGFPTAPL
jgi:hypothetical protein